jgi:pimeloyl-ACP methyl ester carboxylesterase
MSVRVMRLALSLLTLTACLLAVSTTRTAAATPPPVMPWDTSEPLTVLTLEPLDYNLGGNTLISELRGVPCAGRAALKVDYPASLAKDSIDNGVSALDALIHSTPGPKLVFGHSQGAQVASRWLRSHADGPDAPPAAELSFLFIGNPLRKYGGFIVGRPEVDGATGLPTRNDTAYAVTDIALQYDGWADYPTAPGQPAALNALTGKFARHSRGYFTADAEDPNRKKYQENTTTYVLLPAPPVIDASQSDIERSYSRPEQ